jgi:hypothetical protein
VPRPISLIPVDRWVFWAGVLILVSWFPLEIFVAPALDQPVGTGVDFTPLVLVLGLIFLFASAFIGGGARAARRTTNSPSPPATTSGPR